MSAILESNEQFVIRPTDIPLTDHLWNTFDHHETEISARYILKMCQRRGNWQPFTRADIETVYEASGHQGFTFNRLIEPGYSYGSRGRVLSGGGWIVERDGMYFITEEFVRRVSNQNR